ncbi:MAG: FCD domain-containing protein [Propionibacteriaceae bacterium]|nr:FCD domain-containing protein [Propionibacteriaceae bacterium]
MADVVGSKMARKALEFLRRKIATGEWPINSQIPKEPELMEMLGVGKSTVREAVRSLANLGMLETIRGVGTFVRSRAPISSVLTEYLSDYTFNEILTYRRALEIEAAQQAAVNRSTEQLAALQSSYEYDLAIDSATPITVERGDTPGQFHYLVFEAAGNRLLVGLYSGVMAALRRNSANGPVTYRESHGLRQREHGAILEAIREQDIIKAAHAMALHVEHDLTLDETLAEDESGAANHTVRALRAIVSS